MMKLLAVALCLAGGIFCLSWAGWKGWAIYMFTPLVFLAYEEMLKR